MKRDVSYDALRTWGAGSQGKLRPVAAVVTAAPPKSYPGANNFKLLIRSLRLGSLSTVFPTYSHRTIRVLGTKWRLNIDVKLTNE